MNIEGMNANKIQIKYNKLRRSYQLKSTDSKKSGAAGAPIKPYDMEMDTLWGFRPKFQVPKKYGVDTSKNSNNEESTETEREETEEPEPETEEPETEEPEKSQENISVVSGKYVYLCCG